MSPSREALDAALLAAHAADNREALTTLYVEAADQAEDRDIACFFLTQAYVFALEAGDGRAKDLHARLKAEGREA